MTRKMYRWSTPWAMMSQDDPTERPHPMTSQTPSESTSRPTPVGGVTWLELSTDQPVKSRNFYAELFGWRIEDSTMPGFGLAFQGETLVCGVIDSTQFPNVALDGDSVPNAFTVYLRTADLEASLHVLEETGGKDLSGIREVPGQGRFAIVLDPAGACVGLWEHREFTGLDLTLAPGTGVWFETMTRDYDAAAAFYERAAGWQLRLMSDEEAGLEEGEATGIRYGTHTTEAGPVAGMCEADTLLPEGTPSFWRAYFRVEDTDAAVQTVQNLGGTLLDGPMDSPFGRVATVADPTGAMFQLVDGNQS